MRKGEKTSRRKHLLDFRFCCKLPFWGWSVHFVDFTISNLLLPPSPGGALEGYLSHNNQFTSHGPINRWFDNAILILEDYITKLQELAWITTECNNWVTLVWPSPSTSYKSVLSREKCWGPHVTWSVIILSIQILCISFSPLQTGLVMFVQICVHHTLH